MNRKLPARKFHHTLLALAASTGVFALLLLAARPAPPATQTARSQLISAVADDSIDGAVIDLPSDENAAVEPRSGLRHLRRARSLLALPYFSFAQGLRPGRS